MYKIGVIGDRDSALGFKAVGLDVFPCATVDEAKKALREIAREEYAIIFITESLAKEMREAIDQYKDQKLPSIIPIPGMDGNYGVGFGNLKKSVERAIGADILFGGDQ
jgi:V/A-type H+-transporting ATPase subunit F